MTAILSVAVLAVAAASPLTVSVRLKVPDSTWHVSIQEVREVGGEYWVLAQLSQKPRSVGIQVISTVQDEITLQEPVKPVMVFVIGKTWKWKNGEDYSFVGGRDDLPDGYAKGRVVYAKPLDAR